MMDEVRESQQQSETILESAADDSRSAGRRRGPGAAAGEPPRQSVDNELLLAARDGPGPARDRLVDASLPGIEQLARDVWTAGPRPPSQLIEQGVHGLLRALDRYDSTLDTPFWAYASWWVRQAMRYERW
jgi:DNA-directed RNA polymerase sigma subunit (sigma70/sigma32)